MDEGMDERTGGGGGWTECVGVKGEQQKSSDKKRQRLKSDKGKNGFLSSQGYKCVLI